MQKRILECNICRAHLSPDGSCTACEKRAAAVKKVQQWRVENEEEYREKRKEEYQRNKDKYKERVKKRRDALDERTPQWLTKSQLEEIKAIYAKASRLKSKTGVDYHVDHIVPLQGTHVSGLNVPWNLQILTADANDGKGTKFDFDSSDNIGARVQYIPEPEFISHDAEERPLTYQEESFCVNYVRCGDARRAYSEAFRESPVRSQIDQLSNDQRIINRITHIRLVMREATEFTVTEHLMNMAMLRDQAVKKGDMKAAIQAEKHRGEVAGFYTKQVAIGGMDGNGLQIVANLLPQIEGTNFTDADSGVTISEPTDGLALSEAG